MDISLPPEADTTEQTCSDPAFVENVQKLVLGDERRRLEMIQM